jgi:hypothetical protein
LMLSVRVSHGIMFSGPQVSSSRSGPALYLHRPWPSGEAQFTGPAAVQVDRLGVRATAGCHRHGTAGRSRSPSHGRITVATEFESESDRDEHRDWHLRAGDRDRASSHGHPGPGRPAVRVRLGGRTPGPPPPRRSESALRLASFALVGPDAHRAVIMTPGSRVIGDRRSAGPGPV